MQPTNDKILPVYINSKVCNCADCGALLMSHIETRLETRPEGPVIDKAAYIAGRINGRPYCSLCLIPHYPRTAGRHGPNDNDSSFDNVIRAYEETSE